MKNYISSSNFHETLAKEILDDSVKEIDVLCLMLLLHACQINLSEDAVVSDGYRGFAAITTRHASEVAASLFPQKPQSEPSYWYVKWNGEWNVYGIIEDIPDDLKKPLELMKKRIESHPWINKLVDEDWDVISSISE